MVVTFCFSLFLSLSTLSPVVGSGVRVWGLVGVMGVLGAQRGGGGQGLWAGLGCVLEGGWAGGGGLVHGSSSQP